MILIFTPNPSLDKTILVPGFEAGGIFRPAQPLCLAGGKGFNFSRALRTLGGTPFVVGPLAGHAGRRLAELAEAEGLACDPVWVPGETRSCLTVIDPQAGRVTDIYEAGPPLSAGEWRDLTKRLASHLPKAQAFVVCGSFPPGTPETGLGDLLASARAESVQTLLDTYGPHLALALMQRPALVKINQQEAGDLLGRALPTPAAARAALTAIQARGAEAVVITLGTLGAVGIDAAGDVFGWAAPQVPTLSAVGSGDSFFAGVVLGLARGGTLAAAVQLGVAVGAANTLQIGAGVFDYAQIDNLRAQVRPLNREPN